MSSTEGEKGKSMEYNHLIELIKTVSDSNISGFQYEEGDTKILIATGDNALPGSGLAENAKVETVSQSAEVESGNNEVKINAAANMPVKKKAMGNIVKSPLVGTFYAAPAEDAEAFVQVGDVVKKGQTLAIVEAMKLMNDIETDYEGTVLEILVKNGDTVEYGQPLFAIG